MKKVNVFLREDTLEQIKSRYEALGFKNQSEFIRAVIEREVHGPENVESAEGSRLDPRTAAIVSRTCREVLAIKHVVSDVLRAQCSDDDELQARIDAIEADTRQDIRTLAVILDEQEA